MARKAAVFMFTARLSAIERSLFDWESGEARPFSDENYELMKRVAV